MEEEIIRCTADLQNKIYEAGLFRPEEKVVLATKGLCAAGAFHRQDIQLPHGGFNDLKGKTPVFPPKATHTGGL